MGLFGGGSPFSRGGMGRSESTGRRGPSLYALAATGLLAYFASKPRALQNILGRFQRKGMGNAADSWVGMGPNQHVSPQDVQSVLDPEDIQELSQRSGLSPQDVTRGLAETLPNVVDKLTPHGQVPPPNILQQGIDFLRGSLSRQ